MFLLSGLFVANQHHDPGGQDCPPGFVFGGLAGGGLSCDSEEVGKLGGCRERDASKQYLSAIRARR